MCRVYNTPLPMLLASGAGIVKRYAVLARGGSLRPGGFDAAGLQGFGEVDGFGE
jgi:hypothetical protein